MSKNNVNTEGLIRATPDVIAVRSQWEEQFPPTTVRGPGGGTFLPPSAIRTIQAALASGEYKAPVTKIRREPVALVTGQAGKVNIVHFADEPVVADLGYDRAYYSVGRMALQLSESCRERLTQPGVEKAVESLRDSITAHWKDAMEVFLSRAEELFEVAFSNSSYSFYIPPVNKLPKGKPGRPKLTAEEIAAAALVRRRNENVGRYNLAAECIGLPVVTNWDAFAEKHPMIADDVVAGNLSAKTLNDHLKQLKAAAKAAKA